MWELMWFILGGVTGTAGHAAITRLRGRRDHLSGDQDDWAYGDTVALEPSTLPSQRTVLDELPAEFIDTEVVDTEPAENAAPTTVVWDDEKEAGAEPLLVESADNMAWLRGADGDYLLNLVTNVVGAAAEVDILLDAADVAARHAIIRARHDQWWLETVVLGTVVNDRSVEPGKQTLLHDGDRVRFGSTAELTMFVPSGDAPPAGLELLVAGTTATGERPTNQDHYHHDRHLLVVADGVAGRPAGKLAAELTVHTVTAAGRDQEFAHTMRQANLTVRAQGESDPRTAGMATTLDAAVLRQDGRDHWMHGVHVGDGIALVQRGGKLTVLTHAHTLASELVAHGRLSASQSEDHPGASTLLRAVGLDRTISPDLWTERAEPGTRFLLASDGLLAALGSRRLEAELVKLHDVHPQQCVDNLVAVALALGAPDNVTVVVGDVVAAGTAREMVLSRKALERGPVDSRLLPPAEPGERA